MRCDCCPLCPIAEDDVCPESEGEYGIEHADGMLGCRHPKNWAKKRDEEHTEYLSDMGTDMGVELCISEDELKIAVDYCKHMVGLDYERPYQRHGRLFYKPYRNHWEAPANGNKILDKLPRFLVTREADEMGVLYALTVDGLKWLGRQLKITIKC
jgi:hypothetical protein|nr:MAG TPA: hypothetical protein [Caudoviricetes sp.]